MAAEDNEAAERPVREQLKKASIAGVPETAKAAVSGEAPEAEDVEVTTDNNDSSRSESRGRLQKKRSFEEVEGEETQRASSEINLGHTRKRSRDSAAEDEHLNNGKRKASGEQTRDVTDPKTSPEANGEVKAAPVKRAGTPDLSNERAVEDTVEAMASPKTKRSRLHSATVEANGTLPSDNSLAGETVIASKAPGSTLATSQAPTEERSATAIPPDSGFANTSSSSPFGALSGSKSPPAQTSESAFKSSGFGALVGSSSSGFGAVGKGSGGFGTGGSFATGAKSPPPTAAANENDKPASAVGSTFGGALGQKSAFALPGTVGTGFGTAASGFGKLGQTGGFGGSVGGSGFGSLGGGGLNTFASGKPTPLAGSSKPPKAFGGPAGEEEGEEDAAEDADAGYKSPLSTEEDHKDERFYEQEVETGEEDETTQYSCRAKLYNFATVAEGKREWRERGLGVLRLNVKHPADEEKPKARFLMRADGSHRVVLNTPVKKEITFGSPQGGQPQGGLMFFMGTIDGKSSLELLQLKVSCCVCKRVLGVSLLTMRCRYGSSLRWSCGRRLWSCRGRCKRSVLQLTQSAALLYCIERSGYDYNIHPRTPLTYSELSPIPLLPSGSQRFLLPLFQKYTLLDLDLLRKGIKVKLSHTVPQHLRLTLQLLHIVMHSPIHKFHSTEFTILIHLLKQIPHIYLRPGQ